MTYGARSIDEAFGCGNLATSSAVSVSLRPEMEPANVFGVRWGGLPFGVLLRPIGCGVILMFAFFRQGER
jgi:hypothetical protein